MCLSAGTGVTSVDNKTRASVEPTPFLVIWREGPMSTKKLTQAVVDGVRAPTRSGKQELIWDEGLRGFGLLLSGATNRISYVCQRKLGDGRTRRVTIGAANVLPLEDARREALAVLRTFAHGVDPKAARRRAA